MLPGLAVHEAERWLWPELESWDSGLQDQSDLWTSLNDRVGTWLEFWISKHNVKHSERALCCFLAPWR